VEDMVAPVRTDFTGDINNCIRGWSFAICAFRETPCFFDNTLCLTLFYSYFAITWLCHFHVGSVGNVGSVGKNGSKGRDSCSPARPLPRGHRFIAVALWDCPGRVLVEISGDESSALDLIDFAQRAGTGSDVLKTRQSRQRVGLSAQDARRQRLGRLEPMPLRIGGVWNCSRR
jgi:hypothetical protein